MQARVRDTTALAIGSALSGFLAYVFFALSTRTLGAVAAAPISVLWTYWSFAAAALTFPLQHWIARSVAAHGGEGAVRDSLPRVSGVVALAALGTGLVAWTTRHALFHQDEVWFPLLVALVTLGAGFIGVVRGGLAAKHRFVTLATVIVSENAARCVGAIMLIIAQAKSAIDYGICLAAGSFVGILWPSSLRFARGGATDAPESPMGFLSGAAGGQVLGQTVLTGGPVLLALSGGTAAQVTSLFAVLALFRAPYTVAIGLVSPLTGRLTTMVVADDRSGLRRVRRTVLVTTAVVVPLAGVLGGLLGPELAQLIFGNDVTLASWYCLLVAAGSALALANLVLTIMVLAQNRSAAIVRSWMLAALVGVATFALVPATPLSRTCWAFLAAEAGALLALAVSEVRASTLYPTDHGANQ